MAVNLKGLNVDENGNAFAQGSKVIGSGSLLVDIGSDTYELQENISTGVGILLVNITETIASGSLSVSIPSNVLSNGDRYLELDTDNNLVIKE